tara:strand:- start:944 stop:1633 length:690 start_codon:yes stop_codon:yes gene_type:complete
MGRSKLPTTEIPDEELPEEQRSDYTEPPPLTHTHEAEAVFAEKTLPGVTKKAKRPVTDAQRAHLDRIRVKAVEARKIKAAQKQAAQDKVSLAVRPLAVAPNAPAPVKSNIQQEVVSSSEEDEPVPKKKGRKKKCVDCGYVRCRCSDSESEEEDQQTDIIAAAIERYEYNKTKKAQKAQKDKEQYATGIAEGRRLAQAEAKGRQSAKRDVAQNYNDIISQQLFGNPKMRF